MRGIMNNKFSYGDFSPCGNFQFKTVEKRTKKTGQPFFCKAEDCCLKDRKNEQWIRKENFAETKQKKLECDRRIRKEKAEMLNNLKKEKGCQSELLGMGKCNHTKDLPKPHLSLQFHHMDKDKKFENLSRMVSRNKWEDIHKELDKCIVLCANHHLQLNIGDL